MPHITTSSQPGQELKHNNPRPLIRPFGAREQKLLEALPYPPLPRVPPSHPMPYWHAAWLQANARLIALKTMIEQLDWLSLPKVMQMSLVRARALLNDECERTQADLIACGGLLYAWTPEEGGAA